MLYKDSKWWMDILMGICLILAACFVHFDWLYAPDLVTSRAKAKLTIVLWNKFIAYGGGWILFLLAAYYGVAAIKIGLKKYKVHAKSKK